MSKVFIGKVNGETFNNEQDFQVAVAKAMFKGGDLNISSCYKYSGESEQCNCENNQCKCNESVSNDEFKIPTSKLKPNENFDTPSCVNDFDKISLTNYSELSDFLTKNIKYLENKSDKLTNKLKEIKEQYAVIKSELENVEKESENVYNEWDYYNRIKNILQKSKHYNQVKSQCENKDCKCENKDLGSLSISDLIGFLRFI